MKCKYCDVTLLDEEIPDGMCCKCPEYCLTCGNVLSWARLICEHDGVALMYCTECIQQHLKDYHVSR